MPENVLADLSSKLYALLIGIDHYLPNQLPGGSSYMSLSGCVRDIVMVEQFLKNRLKLKQENLVKLTASAAEQTDESLSPTYENMVAAFKKMTQIANKGDQLYIHYSGHGGRTKTIYPKLKANGLDEALVPMDIGTSSARYLRDVELAFLLQDMVKKGIFVTLVLDSCHSGGATRGKGRVMANARGIAAIDTSPRPTESLVASDDELIASWQNARGRVTRNATLGSGWLPEPNGYTLLAACKPSEFAYEWAFGDNESNGALTYWLLDSLQSIGPEITYQHLHNRIIGNVHSQNRDQTPQLQGEDSRVVFGIDFIHQEFAVNVLQVDLKKDRVLLNVGKAQAIRKGAQFAIYPQQTSEFGVKNRQALVEIIEPGATDSWAKIIKKMKRNAVEIGAQAFLINPGHIRLQRTVRILQPEEKSFSKSACKKALKNVENSIVRSNAGFIVLADENEKSDFCVTINDSGIFEVLDAEGRAIENMNPPLDSKDANAANRLVQRLVHLAKYYNVLELYNYDDNSPLAQKLDVELFKAAEDYEPGDPPDYTSFKGSAVVNVGQNLFLRIKNKSKRELNIVVLDLQPDWGITQLYPNHSQYEPFDAGEQRFVPLRADLPDGYKKGRDTLKVFATKGTTNFRWLELPALDRPSTRRVSRTRGGQPDALEQLFAAMAEQRPITRNASMSSSASSDWVTTSVDMHVERENNESDNRGKKI